MLKRVYTIGAGLLCGLVLSVAAPSPAHAQVQIRAAFRAGPILGGQVYQGDRVGVERMVSPFVNAIHALGEDARNGAPFWFIATPDFRQLIAFCPQLQEGDGQEILLYFAGQVVNGLPQMNGAQVMGGVARTPDGRLVVVTRVQAPIADVAFVQPLEPIQLSGGGGYANGDDSNW